MTDYSQLKVPDLKKILQERGLVISGNKADLVGRLQENDKKSGGGATGEDEIDWDEDDTTKAPQATTEAAAAAVAAGGKGQVPNPTAVPNQKAAIDPSATNDLKVVEGESKSAEAPAASANASTTEAAPVPEKEEPKPDFTAGIQQTDAEKEAEKRAARAKRFGVPEDEEAKKLAERAKKFGLEENEAVVKGLDSALPERRPKRGREDKQGGRSAKRQTPDRRTAPAPKVAAPASKPSGRVVDDPTEKAKAEARAKRFQTAA
ncbi:Uncharacterized protein BP5553_01101 [Venustampulla echinocandica]|uniref:SAP domain-containing protein n=1 Tax=Venustampulla echinocandica TaxID=2656787 RepID=A0A370U013_9HELO|nr:Uncharacterized protein BP5553_01101 [Venustampulla echinocandica]RDL41122.1 Uncharacterized protein BP5553_01101 [Venustampulla echinocandica]